MFFKPGIIALFLSSFLISGMVLYASYYGALILRYWDINNGSETLVMSNLVYGKFKSLYDEYKRNKGGAYYYTKDHELVQNTNYIIHLNERIKPAELNGRYEIEAKDLLKELIADPHKFAFLEKPGML